MFSISQFDASLGPLGRTTIENIMSIQCFGFHNLIFNIYTVEIYKERDSLLYMFLPENLHALVPISLCPCNMHVCSGVFNNETLYGMWVE